jgi:hypothetical protein
MIDLESFGELTPDQQAAVRSAMLTICNSGVIKIQQDRNYLRILDGAADEDEVSLAKRIIEFRKSQYGLDAFLLATQQIKDTRDA